MKLKFFRWQTTAAIWLLLAFFISGCSPQPAATPATPTQSPVPIARATSSFGLGDIASISRQDAEDLSAQELVTVLVSQWLEGYKHDRSSTEAILDYQIEEVFIKSPSFTESGMVAAVNFAVQPVGYSDKWGMMGTQIITEDDPWWRLAATFRIVLDGEVFRLRLPSVGEHSLNPLKDFFMACVIKTGCDSYEQRTFCPGWLKRSWAFLRAGIAAAASGGVLEPG